MLEVFTDGDLRDAETVPEVGDADTAVDFDGSPNRVVP
jgi:hypothetical protein